MKSVQRSLRFLIGFLSESGCKGKDFITYLPNFFGSFFSFSFFLRFWLSLRKERRKVEKERSVTLTAPFLCQDVNRSLLSFSKAGAKVEDLALRSKYIKHFFSLFPKLFLNLLIYKYVL